MSSNSNPTIPKSWPGEKGIRADNSSMEPFIHGALQLIQQCGVHTEVTQRSAAAASKWKDCHDTFFNPVNGPGRNFQLPATNSVKRFKTSMISAMAAFANRHTEALAAGNIISPLMLLAAELQEERSTALAIYKSSREARNAANEQRRATLAETEAMMGLAPPGVGVGHPTLPFEVNGSMRAGLDTLTQRTISPRNGRFLLCSRYPIIFINISIFFLFS